MVPANILVDSRDPRLKEVEDKFFPQKNSIPQKRLLEIGDGRTFLALPEITRSLDRRLVPLALV
jgi:hypothetical protein